jgi:Tol biopolymer transport system component
MIRQRNAIMVGFLITIFSAVTLMSLYGVNTEAQTKPSEKQKKSHASDVENIAYATFRPGNWDVYYFASRDSQPKRLTDDPGLDYDAVLSPDGRWVVFCSERRANPDLYVLDLKHEGPPRLLIESDYFEDQAAFSPDGKTLAFVTDREGTADIFKIPFTPEKTVPISKAVRLTNHDGGEFRPAFSPDGKKIAFSTDWDAAPIGPPAERNRQGEIYTMDADGKNVKRLTSSPGWDGSPKWSPDGRTIYFYAKRDDKFRIWAMDADGANQRAISPKGVTALSPALTPDGRIAFSLKVSATDSSDWKIASVALDGTDQRLETYKSNNYWIPNFNAQTGAMVCQGSGPFKKDDTPREAAENLLLDGPLLSPDTPEHVNLPDRALALYPIRKFGVAMDPTGQKLALTDSFYSSHYLAVTDLDGGHEEILHERKDRKVVPPIYVPTWSKDGSWIAWMSGLPFGGPKEENDVWKMRSDGSGAVNLTPNTPGSDGFAEFSGDGKTIVFRSGRSGNFDIYLMNADGSNVRNLTNNPAYDSFPAFSPNNDQIAFSSNRDGVPEEKSGVKTFEIYTLDLKPDGTPGELKRITYNPGQDSHPRYSPDGKWLVFTSERGGINDEEPLIQELFFQPQSYGELYAVRLSDLKTIRLTHNKWEDGMPTWGRSQQQFESTAGTRTTHK